MGVQYQGVVESTGNARFSVTGGQREPDLVLQPTREGMDFTLRLLAANRMAKVVQVTCDFEFEKTSKHPNLTDEDVRSLFETLGGKHDDDEEEEDDEDEVMDVYRPSSSTNISKGGGMPHLESLAIICFSATDETPSFIAGLTNFVSSSIHFPRYTRLSLEGVNLRGSALELRGLAETFRMHPRMHHVQMQGCWFTPEQKADMDILNQAFAEQKKRGSSAANEPYYPRDVGVGLRNRKEAKPTTNAPNGENIVSDEEDKGSDSSWWQRLFCCCW